MAGWRMFGEFTKAEPQVDGTVIVEGIASTETPDSQGDIVTADAVRAAIPAYLEFPAIREMHRSDSAAGTALDIWVDDQDVTHIRAHVVDPVAVKKVETGTYRGFSIGGSIPRNGGRDIKNRSRVVKVVIKETSLVDRPSNPDAVFTLVKCDQLNPEDEEMTTTDETTGTPAGNPDEGQPLKKGLYEVSRLADLLQSLGYLASSTQWEAEVEKDNSPLPARLRAWLGEGATILQEMTAEETQELLASLAPKDGVEVVTAAAKSDDTAEPLAKAGAKYSKATKENMAKLRKAMEGMAECMKAFDDAKEDDEKDEAKEEEKEGEKDDHAKKGDTSAEPLAKSETNAQDEPLAKLAAVTTERDELLQKMDGLQKEHEELKKAHEALKAEKPLKVVPVDKAADTGATVQDEPLKKIDSTPTDPLEAMKKVHQAGGKPIPTHFNLIRLG